MNTATAFDALARHQNRRAQSVLTITALVGPIGLGLRAWRGWASGRRQPHAIAAGADPDVVLLMWVAAAFAAVPPADRAAAWLAAAIGRTREAVAGEVGRMTRYDLDVLRNALPVEAHGPGAAAAFFVLGDRSAGLEPDPTRFVRAVAGGAGPGDPVTRVVRAVAELYPPELWPALLLTPPAGTTEQWVAAATRILERIATANSQVPVAVAVPADEYGRHVGRHPDTRATALLREGFVELRGVSGNELGERLRTAGVEAPLATVARLTADGLAEDVAASFVAASRTVRNPTPADIGSDFRSVHEGFLFEQLESMPQTAGLFRPNQPLEFRHGHRVAEGDLVAESLKLAVEVDGGFYHLTAGQYRRDRRKDWLYQRGGYLVLRFLAEDMVSDLEMILNTILEAVAFRRTSAQPTGGA